jgi:hypothetical protein
VEKKSKRNGSGMYLQKPAGSVSSYMEKLAVLNKEMF